jgi:hypothetical protein
MSRRRSIVGLFLVTVLVATVWFAYSLYSTWRSIPDAYAAWDTGTLIVEYLETHDHQWPLSWEELLSATATIEEHGRLLRGSDGKGGMIYGDLRERVAVDWNADVRAIAVFDWKKDKLRLVTRADGTEFPVVWEGAEPNAMIWGYLKERRDD